MKNFRKFNFRGIFFFFVFLWVGLLLSKQLFTNWKYLVFVCLALSVAIFLVVKFKFYKQVLISLLAFVIGISLFNIENARFNNIEYSAGTHTIIGRVAEKQNSIILDNVIIDGEKARNLKVYGHYFCDIGDYITFESELTKVKLFTLNSFSSVYYRENITHTAYIDSAITLYNETSFDEDVRIAVRNKLNSYMDSEKSAIAYAMLFGDSTDVDGVIKENYRSSGIAHILAVSGLHVSVLCGLLYKLLEHLQRPKFSFVVMLIFCSLYSYLCGFTPSVVRASIMFLTACFTQATAKKYDAINGVSLVGISILILKPFYAFDIGFILSYLCVISIFFLSKSFYYFFLKLRFPKFIASSFSVSLCTQLALLPVTISIFGYTPTYSIFANLICIPLFGFGFTILAFLTILSFIIPPLSTLLFIPNLFIGIINSISSFIANLPLSKIYISGFSVIIIICLYAFLIFASKHNNILRISKIKIICFMLSIFTLLSAIFQIPEIKNNSFHSVANYYDQNYIINIDNTSILVANGDSSLSSDYLYDSNQKRINYLIFNDKTSTEYLQDKIKIDNLFNYNNEIDFTSKNITIKTIIGNKEICLIEISNGEKTFLFGVKELDEWEYVDIENKHLECDIFISNFDMPVKCKYHISYEESENKISQKANGNFTFSLNDATINLRSID